MLYPGKTHVIAGARDAKTFWLVAIALEQIRHGRYVLWVDLEMSSGHHQPAAQPRGERRRSSRRFIYVRPEEALFGKDADVLEQERFAQLMRSLNPSLVVVDSFDAALSLEGLDPNSTADVESWWRIFRPRFTIGGAALGLLDHLAKSRDNRGSWSIGSQRKKGGADVHMQLILQTPLSFTTIGRSKALITKDRGGRLTRPTHGSIVFEPDGSGRVTYRLDTSKQAESSSEAGSFRPTHLMQSVSEALETAAETAAEPLSRNELEKRVSGQATAKRRAIDILISEGFANEQLGKRGARLVEFTRRYRQSDDPKSDRFTGTSSDLVSPRPHLVRDGVTADRNDLVSSSPPYRDEDEVEVKRAEGTTSTSSGDELRLSTQRRTREPPRPPNSSNAEEWWGAITPLTRFGTTAVAHPHKGLHQLHRERERPENPSRTQSCSWPQLVRPQQPYECTRQGNHVEGHPQPLHADVLPAGTRHRAIRVACARARGAARWLTSRSPWPAPPSRSRSRREFDRGDRPRGREAAGREHERSSRHG